jgi:hypothetical protein
MTSDLKPCYCGSSNVKLFAFSDSGVKCFSCGLFLPRGVFETDEKLIMTWNTRPHESQIKREVVEQVRRELFKYSVQQFNQKQKWKEPIESAPYVMWGAVEYVLGKLEFDLTKLSEGSK